MRPPPFALAFNGPAPGGGLPPAAKLTSNRVNNVTVIVAV